MNLSPRSTGISGKRGGGGPVGRAGFTLVEILVAVAVLALILSIVGVMIGSVSQVIGNARKLLNTDDQARLVFIRMASDFSRMLTRKDVDIIFAKQTGSTSAGANDSIYFVTEASGSNSTSFFSSSASNLLTLAGYCIAADAQGTQVNSNVASPLIDLNRLGHSLTWDGGGAANTAPDNLVFVSFAAPTPGSSVSALVTGTTLDGHWGDANAALGSAHATLGSSPTYPPPTASSNYGDYHAIADQIFRFEYCFLLKNGTYSNVPVMTSLATTNQTAGSGAPSPTADTSKGYSIGSRWFDSTNGRAFICSSATKNNAIWGPLGARDVSAIIVAIAMFDRDSRQTITAAATMTNLPNLFADSLQTTTTQGATLTANPSSSAPILMQQNWQSTIDATGFATAAGLTPSIAGHIRVYQRYFYLDVNKS